MTTDKDWEAGKTFFEETGGKPAVPAGGADAEDGSEGGDTSLPASEEGTPLLDDELTGAEPLSWPGGSPGTIPPPG